MRVRFELYTVGSSPPADLWALVGDPRRLPSWTDVDEVASVDPEPLEIGSEIVVVLDGATQRWRVTTVEPRLVEARRDAPGDPVAIGVRVVRDPRGSRLIVAGALDPPTIVGRLRARAVSAPALRRRLEQWANEAVQHDQRS